MNETNPNPNPNDHAPDGVWPNGGSRTQVPDTSMLPGSEKAPPAAVGLLKHAVQGAHETIDRLAGTAVPAVQKLGDRVSVAAAALDEKTLQLRALKDEWVEDARATVRRNPLTWVAAALALGAVIARVTRSR
ncbi:hypothetical protein [Ideonella sp. A 288]|uniref:hypothetical protein n=1 Tax=Ideonella sp. A 288 TaxID=1962181 RepID=UPI000B4B9C4F|nr:hypothetical protein [Ideonella sp. A 288]